MIKDCVICKNSELDKALADYATFNKYLPDLPLFDKYEASVWFDNNKDDLGNLTMQNLVLFGESRIMLSDDMPLRVYENLQGNLAKINISRYNVEIKDNVVIKALNELMLEFA